MLVTNGIKKPRPLQDVFKEFKMSYTKNISLESTKNFSKPPLKLAFNKMIIPVQTTRPYGQSLEIVFGQQLLY